MQLKKLFKSDNKVFKTWIATNILILLIPIIVGEYVYFNSIDIVRHEVENVHWSSLQQIKILVDGKIDELKKIGSTLAIDSKVKTLAYSKFMYSPENLFTMDEVQRDLKKYIISNSFIDNIYLYFDNSKCLLSDKNIYSGSELNTFVEENFMTGMDDWQKRIHVVNNGDIMILKDSVFLYQSISSTIFSNVPEVTLIAVINSEKLKSILSSLDTSSKAIQIINNSNEELMLSGDYAFPSTLDYVGLRAARNIFNINNRNQDYTIIHVGSGVANLEYSLAMPSSMFSNKVKYIETVIILYIGACLVLGLLIVFLVTKRNYSPLKHLIQISSNNSSTNKKSGMNEYGVIENAINSLVHEKENAEERIIKQDIPLRKNFLLRILKGRVDKNRIEELSELYHIYFGSKNFIVMAFDVENLENFPMDDGIEFENDGEDLISFIIQNITLELAGENYYVYFTDIDGLNVFLINHKEAITDKQSLDSMQEHIAGVARKTIDFIKEHFSIGLSAGISDVKTGFSQIKGAYDEALEIIEYKRLMEKENVVIQYGAIEKSSEDERDNINSMKSEIQFMNYLLDNDFKNAGLILDSIMEFYLPPNATNFQIIKYRMFGLINIMMNALGEFKSKADIDYFNNLDPLKRMMNAKSGVELKKQIREIFKNIIEYCNDKESDETPNKVDEIVDYINHHYFDQNLNASTIAMQFGMNVSYMCRVFKKRTETGILDYIHKCRIDNAKLMMSTGLNITEISEKVGYTSSLAMIRIFKKYEGVTPGKYRERLKL